LELIKDYDLGINYHPGKANVVSEAKVTMEVEPTLAVEIRESQLEDAKLKEIQQLIQDNKTSDFSEDSQGT
jgi:hypothetical protein